MSDENKNIESTERKPFVKPKIESEQVLDAGLGQVCNGMTGGTRKDVGPCTTLST